MIDSARRRLRELLASAGMARAFTLAAFGAAFGAFAIDRVSSRVTIITILVGLCLVGIGILIARRAELSWLRLLPTSVAAFVIWALLSVFWSHDLPRSVAGWLVILAFTVLAVTIAHIRDTLQTARALGDVLRWMLGISLGMEILSGILLDLPIAFLDIDGAIAMGGPIQGIFGTRNLLGLVTVIALITFVIEWRTQSVRPGIAIFSVVLAGMLAVLTASPTVFVVAVVVAVATGALALVRHTRPERRPVLQWVLGAVVVVGIGVAYLLRHTIIAWLNAGSDFSLRADLWNTILDFVERRPLQGWGWYGPWSARDFPFYAINAMTGESHGSALNAFFDTLLQLGWIGLLLLMLFAGIALVRSWLVASERRSVVYAWTPLLLIALLVDSMFESFTLSGFGWMLLALLAMRAGQSRSWRETIDAGEPLPGLPRLGPLPPSPDSVS